MVDSIIQGLTDYFMACPLLQDGAFRVDALGEEPIEYMIEASLTTPLVKTYVDGSSVRQQMFNFGSREFYSMDRVQNLLNSSFYEQMCDWVEKQSQSGVLPELPEGCEARKITVDTCGYMFEPTATTARYQIQLTLQYFKEA